METNELVAPARQWRKAQEHLSKRPPDHENCVKDAVGALEGVARILTGKTGQTLSKILPDLARVAEARMPEPYKRRMAQTNLMDLDPNKIPPELLDKIANWMIEQALGSAAAVEEVNRRLPRASRWSSRTGRRRSRRRGSR